MKIYFFLVLCFISMGIFAQDLNGPSSVVYNSMHNCYIVLNENDNSLVSVFINKRQELINSFDDDVADLAMNDAFLFVAMANSIHVFDAATYEFVKEIPVSDAQAINVVCVANDNDLFAVDDDNHTMYKVDVSTDEASVFVVDDDLSLVSDLHFDVQNNKILFCRNEANSNVFSIDTETAEIEILIESVSQPLSGIAKDAKGNIYVTGFNQDRIWKFSPSSENVQELFKRNVDGPNKIIVNQQMGVLVIPAKNENELVFHDLNNIPVSFEELTIINFEEPAGIFMVDMDNDGFDDILATSSGNDGVAWFKNDGVDQSNWERFDIDPDFNNVLYVYAGCINNDTMIDVVVASMINNEISWYENTGETDNSWLKHQVSNAFVEAHEVMLYDVDKNETLDIIAAGAGGKISMWLNNGADTIEWEYVPIDEYAPGARSVAVGDIDGDGDNDMVGAAFATHEVSFYRNEGTHWDEVTIDANLLYSHRVMLSDMDNDTDLDVVAVGYGDRNIYWYENITTDDTYWIKHTIASEFGNKLMAYPADLNSDGNKDIVTTSWVASDVKWFRNDTYNYSESWEESNLNMNLAQPWPIFTCDIDNDSDMDVISGGCNANQIHLWRNNINQQTNQIPKAIISKSAVTTTIGGEIVFESHSLGNIENVTWIFGDDATFPTLNGAGPHRIAFSEYGIKNVQLVVEGPGGIDTASANVFIDSALFFEVFPPGPANLCPNDSLVLFTYGLDSVKWEPAIYLSSSVSPVVVCKPEEDIEYTVTGYKGQNSVQLSYEVNVTISENDNIENATLLSMGINEGLTNNCSTAETAEPVPPLTGCTGQESWCDEGGVQHSVWFKFVAPQSGRVQINCTGFDSQIALYDANSPEDLLSGNYELLYANDDINTAGESEITEAELESNRIYWLQVDGSAGGAIGVFDIIITELASVKEKDNQGFYLFPNPNDGSFRVEFNDPGVFSVFNAVGQMVHNQQVIHHEFFDLTGCPNGVYLCKYTNDKGVSTQKMIVK